ncbi:hypothetical protein MGYG_00166 [Nannizzia gypsea CBS 118893]|uniref:Uncharacterized protein n=1 Tax=Arthroderma gypseum (strain ATCC MYA-4604 / CBS 118893) TaxID=535722 RepID=E5R394_ARTGP|nr:hypothetical protein MGYG_00166 [Nannizzia gypsea CBS 118893]EFQ97123.1 hypothetical protein MGYG_00166 [Nannizzia gypsea CBS 118893]
MSLNRILPSLPAITSQATVRLRPAPKGRFRPNFPTAHLSSWRGTSTEDQSVNRVKKGDITDPQTEATRSGRKEKGKKSGLDDMSKSQSTTERDQQNSTSKAEKEFPKAPKPVIGMTDERGEVSTNGMPIPVSIFAEGGWLIFAFVSGAEGCMSMVHREEEKEDLEIFPV